MEKIISFFTAITMFFSYLFGISVPTADNMELMKNDRLFGLSALVTGQGITADEDYYYTAGSAFVQKAGIGVQFLGKWRADNFRQVKVNLNPIPREYEKNYGCGHIGGISYADGIIYAAVEGTDYSINFIFLYDADDLSFITAYNVSNEILDDGIPWVAIDNANGFAYCTKWAESDKLLRFNLEDMSLSGIVTLSQPVSRIQGGEFYDGSLYLSKDVPHSTDDVIYKVNAVTGEVTQAFTTHLTSSDNESEDIAVFPREDGSLFHIINYDKIIGVNVTHFAPIEK